MAKKGTPSPPAQPDPNVVANAQSTSDINTALAQTNLNAVNQVTPWGTSSYSQSPGTTVNGVDIPKFTQTVTLSPDQQDILNAQNALTKQTYGIGSQALGNIGTSISQPLDFSNLPAAPKGDQSYVDSVQNALYNRATATLDPQYQQSQRQLQTQLANQGFNIGSAGYNTAMGNFERSKQQAYENALNDAIAGASSAATSQFNMASTARQNALQEQLAQRNQPINELATLLGTSSGVNMPQFASVPQSSVGSTNVAGITQDAYNNAYNQYLNQQQQNNSMMGSLFGLGGQALGAWLSDPAAKTAKQPVNEDVVLKRVQQMPMSTYRYKASGNPNMGPMATHFAQAFGGDGHSIEAPVAFGVTLAAIKGLANKVDAMQRRAA